MEAVEVGAKGQKIVQEDLIVAIMHSTFTFAIVSSCDCVCMCVCVCYVCVRDVYVCVRVVCVRDVRVCHHFVCLSKYPDSCVPVQ